MLTGSSRSRVAMDGDCSGHKIIRRGNERGRVASTAEADRCVVVRQGLVLLLLFMRVCIASAFDLHACLYLVPAAVAISVCGFFRHSFVTVKTSRLMTEFSPRWTCIPLSFAYPLMFLAFFHKPLCSSLT